MTGGTPLEKLTITGLGGGYSREAWYLPAPAPARRLGIFLDGEFYVDRMDAPALVRDLQSRGLLADVACLFVSHVDAASRHHDYTCNERSARFVAEDLVSWLRARNEGATAGDHLLAGASLSGLQAAYTTLLYPRAFAATLCHSGSFWWNDEWLERHLGDFAAPTGRFWLSVGDRETTAGVSHPPTGLRQDVAQLPACERFAASLRKRGATVHAHLYAGGHEIPPWRDELPAALAWLQSAPA